MGDPMTTPTGAPRITARFVRFLRDERGTTAIEYALIASVISIVIVGAATSVGSSLEGFFEKVAAAFDDDAG
jgi:pilus assembly protein Flp/PilA